MRVINLEDEPIKHRKICNELEKVRIKEDDIDWVTNLEDGIEKIREAIESGKPYDIAVTDMYYPERPGSGDAPSGEAFISKMKEFGIDIPIILISSQNLRVPGILGTVYFLENSDWEDDLQMLVRKIQ
ncbi:hypothetical protein [Butyrivibrio sp. WCD2001]|uniref:hypothetical protein n=1 Tax=Butyrivibrio sp. WCD2001 TaxID=1280681 RepID=UPI00041C5034|nr:hypothetical protein [Butyrivibrio sp. WCD2001]